MNYERAALLAELSRVYRKDPVLLPALSVAYSGAGSAQVTIADDALSVEGIDGAETFAIDLGAITLGDLVVAINTHGGYLAALVEDSLVDVRAGMLAEEQGREFSGEFLRWTNSNWRLLEPFRRQVVEKLPELDIALDQLNLLKSAAFFADFWGTFTDTVRKAGESDDNYTARQLHELLRPRENGQALAAILEEDFGALINSIRDLRREVFTASGTALRGYYLPGRRYNTATVEVDLESFPTTSLAHAARGHVAAGVAVFVLGVFGSLSLTGAYDLGFGPCYFGTPAAMKINAGTIGVDKIGPP